MRFKPVPDPPADLEFLADAQRAVPLVPGSEDDCCSRLQRRLDLESRDRARTWLTFLRALGLATETPSGFRRTDADPDPDGLRTAFLERVFAAREVHDALRDADRPLTPEAVFAEIRGTVPNWERHRRPRRWEADWRERVEAILAWLVRLDLAERADGGYVAVDSRDGDGDG